MHGMDTQPVLGIENCRPTLSFDVTKGGVEENWI
jgi:hypothetical protein